MILLIGQVKEMPIIKFSIIGMRRKSICDLPPIIEMDHRHWHFFWMQTVGRDSGNDFRFPDIASHTCRFGLIFGRIFSVISFQVDIQQVSVF